MQLRILASMLVVAVLYVAMPSCASAVDFVVSVGSGCRFATLQAGIDGLKGDTDIIHIRQGYTSAPVSIAGKTATIVGGYPDCNEDVNASPDFTQPTQIDGSLNSANRAVINITGHAYVTLVNLRIAGGHNPSGAGGGISFNGISGCVASSPCGLATSNVAIESNQANLGGGIYANAPDPSIITLGPETKIDNNYAFGAGGGIRLEGSVRLLANSPQITVNSNVANPQNADENTGGGRGGGIQALDSTVVQIGSPGYNGKAVIDTNYARYGGGLSLHDDAAAYVFSPAPGDGSPGVAARIENNNALVNGGGVFLHPQNNFNRERTPTLCMLGAGINHNTAQDGTAIYADNDDTAFSILVMDTACEGTAIPGFKCPPGACNTIDSNVSPNFAGATIHIQPNAIFGLDHLEVQGNFANYAISAGAAAQGTLSDCLIANNVLTLGVVHSDAVSFGIDKCTVTSNAFEGASPSIFDVTGLLTLRSSIIWQPGIPTFKGNAPFGQITLADDLLTDASSYDPSSFVTFANVQGANPDFVSVSTLNYQLANTSPAIDDSSNCTPGADLDLIGNPRGIHVQTFDSPVCDIGAFERQSIAAPTFPFDEDFNESDPFALDLPVGWSSVIDSGSDVTYGWLVVGFLPYDGAFSAWAPDASSSSDSSLQTPGFAVGRYGQLSFWHMFELQYQHEGVMLEISIAGGPYQDMEAAGGKFVTGGYVGALSAAVSNPIQDQRPGQMTWTGSSAGYQQVIVNLPDAANGKTVSLRWRMGTDASVGVVGGYWVDHIHIDPTNTDLIFHDGFN